MRRASVPESVQDEIRASHDTITELSERYGLSKSWIGLMRQGKNQSTDALIPNEYILGDAISVMKRFPRNGAAVRGIVTSPPYNLGLKSRKGKQSNWSNGKLAHEGYGGHKDDMPRDVYVAWQRKVIELALDIVGEKGIVLWQHKPVHRDLGVIEQNDILDGFPLRQRIIWNRGSTNNHCKAFCPPTYEFIALLAGRQWTPPKAAYIESRKWGSVWNIDFEKNCHEAPFPTELARRMVLMVPGAVLDPFAGSGTVGIAAAAQGKDYYLIDCGARNKRLFAERSA